MISYCTRRHECPFHNTNIYGHRPVPLYVAEGYRPMAIYAYVKAEVGRDYIPVGSAESLSASKIKTEESNARPGVNVYVSV